MFLTRTPLTGNAADVWSDDGTAGDPALDPSPTGMATWVVGVPDRLGLVVATTDAGAERLRTDRKLVWHALGSVEFRWYFAGNIISNFGTWMQNTAQVLLVYHLTHSVFGIGILACAQFMCPLLFGSWASVLTERYGCKGTLVGCQIFSALIAAILAIAEFGGWLTERELIVAGFFTGLFFAFSTPAQSVLAPALAPGVDTKAPIAMNSVSYNAGRTLAPVVTIVVISFIGFGWAFAFNAISFAIYVILLLARSHPAASTQPSPERSGFLDGFRKVLLEPKIIILLLMVAAVTVADDPVLVLGPGLARHVFGTSDDWSGYFLSALGGGSVLGSLLPRWRSQSARRAATALGLLGMSMMCFTLAPKAWISVIAAFAAGIACLVAGSAAQALLHDLGQHMGPSGAAQVMGLWLVAWAGSKPIASFADGALPSLVGFRLTGVILATPAILPLLVLVFCSERVVNWAVRSRSPITNTPSAAPAPLSTPVPLLTPAPQSASVLQAVLTPDIEHTAVPQPA